jgi:hypothetical protein
MHFVDEEMGEHVNQHLAIIEGYRATPGTEVFVERKLSLKHLDPSDPLLSECRGTGDTIAINREQKWIAVIDLKYGKHVEVFADSEQLKIYLLLALLEFSGPQSDCSWGSTTIHQPRLPIPPHTEEDLIKTFIYNPNEVLTDFLGLVLDSMHAALAPNPAFNPSKKNCHWCPALAVCAAAQDAGIKGMRGNSESQTLPPMSIDDLRPPFPKVVVGAPKAPRPVVNGAIVLPFVGDLDPGEIADILNGDQMYEIWSTGVKHRAVQLMETGTKIPGWGLKSRTGNRRWKLERALLEKELLALGLKPTDIYTDPKLRTPKQVEDRLPALKKGAIASFYERPEGTPTLVPVAELQQPTVLRDIAPPSNLPSLRKLS